MEKKKKLSLGKKKEKECKWVDKQENIDLRREIAAASRKLTKVLEMND